MAWYKEDNPNKVERKHFERAIELAALCKPERTGKIAPKVGAVIVKNGKIIIESHRNQTGSGDHAEFIAMEQRGIDKVDFDGADLITTLEPCTEKRHGDVKKACADWVKLRRIRKVWIGALDRNPHIRGKAVLKFHDLGIHVGWFPDDLVPVILEQNKQFFEFAKMMTPQLREDELEERRVEIRDLVQQELSSYKDNVKAVEKALEKYPSSDIALVKSPIGELQDALSRLMVMDPYDVTDWIKIGSAVFLANEIGIILSRGPESLIARSDRVLGVLEGIEAEGGPSLPLKNLSINAPGVAAAGRAFDTATKINSIDIDGIIGMTSIHLIIGEYNKAFAFLESIRTYIAKPNRKVAALYSELSRALRHGDGSKWRLCYKRAREFKS